MRKIGIFILTFILMSTNVQATEETLQISAESGIIMEASTGNVLYEKEADKELPPASVTKVMTLLLIFDAIEEGKISKEDEVVTSEYAASMGGSQVFLEAGEKQTVETMIKCIAVASANDACVAMAELISGTEEAFVAEMNERAANLNMTHTHFENCNGLDADGHLTTARDIAIMSRELITKYPEITEYTTIWMENITHATKKGSEEFGLSNTNKLLRQYEYATGLKTGSTSKAKFCLSATARKDNIDMIAVVMAEPDSKTRVKDSIAMLNYGFSKCSYYEDENVLGGTQYAEVEKGKEQEVEAIVKEAFTYVDTNNSDLSNIEKTIKWNKNVAPIKENDIIGSVTYKIEGKEIGKINIHAKNAVERMQYLDALGEMVSRFLI